jgi:hypothetical protein
MRLGLIASFVVALGTSSALAQDAPPSLRYASYFGGSGADGPVYGGPTLITYAEETNSPHGQDIRVVRLDPGTHALVFSVLIGGTGRDTPAAIAQTLDGDVWVTGQTLSTDFPLVDPIQSTSSGGATPTAFLVRLSSSGTVTFSTFFAPDLASGGGSAGTALASTGNILLFAGWTCGTSLPASAGAVQASARGACDAFVTTFSATDGLVFATYLGGTGYDAAFTVAIDAFLNVYVGGGTSSADLPATPGVFQSTAGQRACRNGVTPVPCRDGFIARLSIDYTKLGYLTYVRETDPANTLDDSSEEVLDLTVNRLTSEVYATGYTHSGNLFPTTPGALRTTCLVCGGNSANTGRPIGDAFVLRLNATGSALAFSTFLGGTAPAGTDGQVGRSIGVDEARRIYIGGETTATDFPIVDGGGTGPGFVVRLNPSGSVLEYSTRLPGAVYEIVTSTRAVPNGRGDLDAVGSVWASGSTGGGLPTTADAAQSQFGGVTDGFLAAIAPPVTVHYFDRAVQAGPSSPAEISGWAFENASVSDSGIDGVHVYAYPNAGAGTPIFLGLATVGLPRPDVAAQFGAAYADAGWSLSAPPLSQGIYLIAAFSHSRVTGRFTLRTLGMVLVPNPVLTIDSPAPGSVVAVGQRVFVGGWAIDLAAGFGGMEQPGTGIDAIHVWVYPDGGAGTPFFAGVANYGVSRPDVGSRYGSRFTPSGYELDVNGLAPGTYLIAVFAHDTWSDSFVIVQTRSVTIQ